MDVLKLFCWVKNQVILWKVQTNKLYSNINLFSCEIKPSLYSWHCWNKSRKWLWTESTISKNLVQVQTTSRNIFVLEVDGTWNVDWLIDVVSFVTNTRLIVPRKCVVHLPGKSWAVHVDEKVCARDHCCRCDKCLWWWSQAHLWLCVLPLSFVSATRQLRLYAEEYLTHRDITFAYYLCVFHHSLLVDRFSARYVRTIISVKYIFTQRKHPICIYCQQGNLNEMSLFFFFIASLAFLGCSAKAPK